MKTKPPCKVNGIDCSERYVGCRAECDRYHEWMAVHEREMAARRQSLKRDDADARHIERAIKSRKKRQM